MLGNEAAAEKSVGPKGGLFIFKQNTDWYMRVYSTSSQFLILLFKLKSS